MNNEKISNNRCEHNDLAIVTLYVRLSQPGTGLSPGYIKTFGLYHIITEVFSFCDKIS